MPRSEEQKDIAVNRRARHDYFIEETYEAGLVLQGSEVKSLREGRANLSDSYARLLAQVDPHSPGRYRAIGPVVNMPEFWKAFGCKKGQPMVSENACRVW